MDVNVELENCGNASGERSTASGPTADIRKLRMGCKAIVKGRMALNYYILTAYEKALAKFGFFLARRPLLVLLVWLLVVIASCLGFILLRVEQPTFERFTATDSQSRQDLHRAAQFFPLLEARQEQIIMVPKHGQNILSEDCLADAVLVHQTIVNISGYSEICFRQSFSNTTEKHDKEDCVISSPLVLAGTHFKDLRNFSSILRHELTDPTVILSTGETFNSSFNKMFSNFHLKSSTDPSTAQADALRVVYFVIKTTSSEKDKAVLGFEESFESMLLPMGRHLKCASLSFKTGKTANDALQNILKPEVKPLYLSALTMVILVFIVIYLSSNILSCLTTVALIISAIILPFTCAAGIVSMASISLYPTSLFIPFLLLGKATSDVVLFLGEWDRRKVPSLEHRASNCVTRAGLPAALSALCGTIPIGIAIKSSFDVISDFFILALVTFAILSVSSFIVTVTLLIYFERRLREQNTLCLPRCRRRSPCTDVRGLRRESVQQLNLRHILKSLAQIITSVGGKILSLFILACIIGLCVSSAFQTDERTSTTESLYQSDNFKQFNAAQQKFFGNETDTSIVFPQEIDYSKETVQNEIINVCEMLKQASYDERESLCWMSSLRQWAKFKNVNCSNSDFYRCLDVFLNQSRHESFRRDLRFGTENLRRQILASRIHVQVKQQNQYREDRRSLEELRNDLNAHSFLEAMPVSEEFFKLDDLFLLEKDTVFVLIIATVVVFVHSLLSSSSFRISTCLAITLDVLVLEAAGIMETWGIHLNQISFLILFITIILSLNFSIQVAHSFVFSEKKAVRDRMVEALISVGWSVLVAASIAISGSISLGFIYPSLTDIFHRLIPLVLVLGLIHALLIFPSIIVLFFEFVDSFTCQNDVDMLPIQQEKSRVSLHLQDGLAQQQKSKRAGISIVGISCRFPGASSKDLFWDLLEKGKSSIGAFPQNRTEEHKTFYRLYHPKRFVSGRLCAVNGSYLEEIQNFDNKFFGISNQEARGMDPQQRILLQVVYEAIEDAGMRLEDLQRCRTGVFVGVMNLEYGGLVMDSSNYNNIDQFSSTGITASILANRVSFCLNLTGPSLAVDTACSSSLTALKIACDNLHNQDCEIAIVCASNIVLNHAQQMVSSMAGLLAPDGRCKSFDASGDGYGRGEGFAAVILKLSNAALSDKDDEYCEIIACGMNNDGQNAVPMTAPSAKMQAELSRMVLEQSGVNPEDVDYFEAHGTGTAIGDVIEVTSIADTYTRGHGQATRALRVGSVKSNLNHTESTSGLAGLIKVALMIKNKRFVPTVNVHVLNPKLKLEEKGLVVQQTSEPWNTESGKPRLGAVNSFGYGGSNVHVVLREVNSKQNSVYEESVGGLNNVLTISARSKEALQNMARRYSNWLKDHANAVDESFVQNLCYSLNERRSQLPHRLALAFVSISDASKSLEDYAEDSAGWEKLVCYGEMRSNDPKLVFLFGGQGAQWYAMGRQLIQTEDVFKEAILTVSNVIKDLGITWSLEEELMASEQQSRIAENCIAQPATFAVQYATARLLMSWRIYPSAVIGHSLGEFAAACVSGIITVKEAVQLVMTRSTLQERCPSNGGMAALGMSEEKAKNLLTELRLSATLDIAAVNDAKSVTVSGDAQSIDVLGQHLAMHAKDTFWRVLGTKRAFHSTHMEVIKKPFQAAMKRVKLNPQLSKIPMYSTVAGEVLSGQQLNSDYWWRNIRHSVQFYPAMNHLLNDGYKQIIEISTQPILAHYVKQIAVQNNRKQEIPVVVATLPRKRVPVEHQHKCFLQNTVCKLYTLGFPIDWTCVQGSPSAKFVRSLNYPWLESSFWYREHPPKTIIPPLGVEKTTKKQTHPFLGQVKMTDLYSGVHCWETEIDLHRFPNLKDHALIQGGTVMPGAAYLEMAFAMVKDKFVDVAGLELSDVKLSSLLTLPEAQVRSLRLRLMKTDRIDTTQFHITSVQDDQSEIKLSSGSISVDLLHKREKSEDEDPNQVDLVVNELMTNMTEVPMERFRQITEKFGFNYGPTYSIIKKIWQCNNEGLCLVDISESQNIQAEAESHVVHPSILDACLQSCFVPLGNSLTDDKTIVPVGFKSITLNDVPSTNQLYCHVTADATEFGRFDVSLMSPSGNVLLTMCEFRIAELTSSSSQLGFAKLAYEVKWKEDELRLERPRENVPHFTCIVLKDSSDFSDILVTRLQAAKVKVITIDPPNDLLYNNEAQKAIETVFSEILPSDSSNLKVVNMWPVETTLLPNKFDVIDQAQSLAFNSSVSLLKLLMTKEYLDSRLFLITESTQVLSSCNNAHKTKSIPWGSTVWGLRRTANLEEFNLRVTTVDLSNKSDMHEVDSLIDEILGDSIEDEVAFRDGKRFINRLHRLETSQKQSTITNRNVIKEKKSLYLSTIPSSGTICLREQSLSKPAHSELAIDLLYSWTPSESLVDVSKPNGCVFVLGKVTGLPEKSEHTFQIGDEVCGVISSGRVSSSLSIKSSEAFVKPASLTKEQATCIPACLAIASHALQIAVSGEKHQKLLIHEANRGPGPAAVVLAKTLGHRVFCTIPDTCQTSTKTLLLDMGAESVMCQSSTTLRGDSNDPFDAVVFFYPPCPNAIQKSSRSLKRGGRVIILSSGFCGDIVFPAKTNVKYEREDIVHVLRSPLVFEKLSLESLKLLKDKGVLEKLLVIKLETVDLPTSIKALNKSIESPRKAQMKTSADISLLLHSYVSFGEDDHLQNIPVLPRGLDECGLKENRTYLVAGGMRGFGFEVACWMVENGARSVGIIGRSKPSEAKRQQVQAIERRTGAKIHTFQIDISSQDQMSSFKEQLQSLPNVAGIVHTAMVLRDEFIKNLKFESFTEVMGPKIKGSFLLHQMSLEMDLDFFVMFSSMASIIGNMGQSSYSACNVFQDSLAQYRRLVLGLPGLAINWGPISGAGVMVRETGVAKLLTIGGLGFIHAKDGVKYMAKVLTEEPGRCQLALFDADWPRFIKRNAGLRSTSRLTAITAEINASENQTGSVESLAQRIILEKDAEKRAELASEYVAMLVTEWTGISSPSETDLNKSLYSYGADSTAAVTLKMQLEANLQVSFEIFYFMQPDTTPLKLARDITAKLGGDSSNPQQTIEQPENSENREDGPTQTQPVADKIPSGLTSGSQIQVVPLYTPAGSAIKFFCVHPSHRYAMSLMPISTGFQGQDLVSFYALGFTDLTAVSEDWGSVRELAVHYVQLISEEQRHGPYFLGGYSYGGLLAYEMASLLTEQNQRVEFVAMIDTFPWSPLSQTISTRLASMQDDENSHRCHVKLQFENFLKKLALDSLKMTANEYRQLREEHSQDGAIEELQRRSLEKGFAAYNLKALRESLLRDQTIASRTHHEWQPPEVRYRGPLTFLKCHNTRFSPSGLRSSNSSEEVWGQLVDGGTTVLVCPGDHYSMSELPRAHVTGSILATALAFNYRMLFPEFPRSTRTFHQRRAVEKFCSGVNVFLHSKRGNKKPHFGRLIFQEVAYKLKLRSKAEEGEINEYEKTKKTIDLKDLLMVQPGRLVSSALEYAGRRRRVGALQSGNLGQIASVITSKRVYNLEFTDYSDLKAFYDMIEAVFAVTLLTS